MDLVIILTGMLVVIGGCTHSSNLVPATTDTSRSGALLYTLTTPDTVYTPHDTLDATLSVRNTGSVTDSLMIGDAFFFTWALNKRFREGEVSIPRNRNEFGFDPISPGQSMLVERFTHALTGSSGNPLPAGHYSFNADYAGTHLSLDLTIEQVFQDEAHMSHHLHRCRRSYL